MNRFLTACLLAASMFAGGCALQTEESVEDPSAASEDELTTAQLAGIWVAESGPIDRIEFTKDKAKTLGGWSGRQFSASVDNGVRCITTPCPSSDDVAGVYRVSFGTRVTFASYDKPSLTFSKYLGDYTMYLKNKQLHLKKTDGTVVSVLRREEKPVGEKCGNAVCGAGTYCCNPLMSICVKEGMMCIQ